MDEKRVKVTITSEDNTVLEEFWVVRDGRFIDKDATDVQMAQAIHERISFVFELQEIE